MAPAPWRPVHTNLLRDLHKTVSPYIKCHRREVFTMANATYSQNDSLGGAPDYARYDRIWQRVAPALDPYPQVRAANQKAVPAMAMTMQQSAAVGETEQTVQNRYTAPGDRQKGRLRHLSRRRGGQTPLWRRNCSCPVRPPIPAAWARRPKT